MQRSEESSEPRGELVALVIEESRVGRLTAGKKRCADERPRERVARHADATGLGNGNWEERRKSGQHGDLALDPGNRDRPSGKPERPCLLDRPDGVVPAFSQ